MRRFSRSCPTIQSRISLGSHHSSTCPNVFIYKFGKSLVGNTRTSRNCFVGIMTSRSFSSMAEITAGSPVPEHTFRILNDDGQCVDLQTEEIFQGKKV